MTEMTYFQPFIGSAVIVLVFKLVIIFLNQKAAYMY